MTDTVRGQHTRGPWHAGEQLLIGRYLIRDDNGEILAEVVPMEDHETTANARLIAAAPDLLAMLHSARSHLTLFISPTADSLAGRLFRDIDAAIAKAAGRR